MNRRPHTAGLSGGIHDDSVERMVLSSLIMMPCGRWLSSHIALSQPKERGRCLCRIGNTGTSDGDPNLCGLLSTIYILVTALADEGYLPRVYRKGI